MPHPEPTFLFDSVEKVLEALSENPDETCCPRCGGEFRYFKAKFWIEGTEKAWHLRVPVCPDCET